ncbi:uncharacterized protein LOC121727466 [Aricia agestis]|uniref:uncharacterized protein LOC121727466 n=1 Tax=Aricia agestis TaxID=91739 RepID=UPI001C20536C|nr:uncharacterized protein LOC121727466 [Aricia agestis]
MCSSKADFDYFEHEFIELVGQFQSLSLCEKQLREELRKEAGRAEKAEAERSAAERLAQELRANAAAAAAGAAQATKALAAKQDELLKTQMQLEISERERNIFKDKCMEMTNKANEMDRELQNLRPLQKQQANLQRQYIELQERIQAATTDARSEASKLENELRRVERCASAGSEVRERARLAAAAHVRERRLAAAEMQQTSQELKTAHVEIIRLGVLVADLQQQLANVEQAKDNKDWNVNQGNIDELRGALEAERAGCARLEKALAAAVADNATLAAQLRAVDSRTEETLTTPPSVFTTDICPIDLFLAD